MENQSMRIRKRAKKITILKYRYKAITKSYMSSTELVFVLFLILDIQNHVLYVRSLMKTLR